MRIVEGSPFARMTEAYRAGHVTEAEWRLQARLESVLVPAHVVTFERVCRYFDQQVTQVDIARELGRSKQHVWQVLHGIVRPSPEFLEAARKLGAVA